jgi:hypothetical protein
VGNEVFWQLKNINPILELMKFIVSIILIGLLAFIGGLYTQWWSLAIAAFIVAVLIPQRPGRSFFSGFIAIFLLWGLMALWIDIKNQGILSEKIASILPLGGSRILLILVTAFVGALVAGFAALSGSYIRTSK